MEFILIRVRQAEIYRMVRFNAQSKISHINKFRRLQISFVTIVVSIDIFCLVMLRPQSSLSRQESEMASKSLREYQATRSSADPKQRLRLLCLSRGACGLLSLGRLFRRMDEDGNKQLNYEEFVTGLREAGLEVTDEELRELFQEFDTDNSGGINLEEFFVAIRVKNVQI